MQGSHGSQVGKAIVSFVASQLFHFIHRHPIFGIPSAIYLDVNDDSSYLFTDFIRFTLTLTDFYQLSRSIQPAHGTQWSPEAQLCQIYYHEDCYQRQRRPTFRCPQRRCSRSYRRKEHLTLHSASHNQSPAGDCPFCDKVFSTSLRAALVC